MVLPELATGPGGGLGGSGGGGGNTPATALDVSESHVPPIFIWNAPASTVNARYRTNTGEVPSMVSYSGTLRIPHSTLVGHSGGSLRTTTVVENNDPTVVECVNWTKISAVCMSICR